MELHIEYETCPEQNIDCFVDDRLINKDGQFASPGIIPDDPESLRDAFQINRKMKLLEGRNDTYDLHVNDRCRLVNISKDIDDYTISGRSPLKWAIEVLCVSAQKFNETGLKDDPNSWYVWSSNPFELIRHLRRLIYISLKSREIINNLPAALSESSEGVKI